MRNFSDVVSYVSHVSKIDRDQTQIEPFSARHNVVVGRNGSGKSNFFAGRHGSVSLDVIG